MAEQIDDDVLDLARQVFDLAREGQAEVLAEYVDAGVPVDLTNEKGDTLLLLAAYYDSPVTVRVLLARGADPERVNDRGQTPLAAAVFRSSTDSVQALLAAGASPLTGGPNALDTARFFGLEPMVALLEGAAPRG